jgi:hypothetical protein
VIVRPCVWQDAFNVSQFQVLPADAKPIFSSALKDYDEAMVSVVEGVKRVTKKLRIDRIEQKRVELIEKGRVEKERLAEKAQKEHENALLLAKQQEGRIKLEKEEKKLKIQEENLIKVEIERILPKKGIDNEDKQKSDSNFSKRKITYLLFGGLLIFVIGVAIKEIYLVEQPSTNHFDINKQILSNPVKNDPKQISNILKPETPDKTLGVDTLSNAKLRNRIINDSRGIHVDDHQIRYYIRVLRTNNIGFSQRERRDLTKRLEVFYNIRIYSYEKRKGINCSENQMKLREIKSNSDILSKEQREFLENGLNTPCM